MGQKNKISRRKDSHGKNGLLNSRMSGMNQYLIKKLKGLFGGLFLDLSTTPF
jgi:hypothetical protein